MLWMICKKCGHEEQEEGLLSQRLWVWPVFAVFPALFLGYYCLSLFPDWPQRLRQLSAGIVFSVVMVTASIFLRAYCRNMEFERFRRRRCPECHHTHWDYREGRKS